MLAVLGKGVRWFAAAFLLVFLLGGSLNAQSRSVLRGRVKDPVGQSVANANIAALADGKEVAHTTSNAEGDFELSVPNGGRFDVRVEAEGFAPATVPSVFVATGKTEELAPIDLAIGPLSENIVVSATGSPTPETQVGASVSVLDDGQIQALNKLDVLENLRLIPGAQIVQTGQRGGTASLFIRGGNSDFNKILVDGIPVNQMA